MLSAILESASHDVNELCSQFRVNCNNVMGTEAPMKSRVPEVKHEA